MTRDVNVGPFAIAILAAIGCAELRAGTLYSIVALPLNFVPCGSCSSGLNDLGQVAGDLRADPYSTRPSIAEIYSNGSLSSLGTLGGTSSSALGINNQGQVVGTSYVSSGRSVGFLYTNGTMINISPLIGNLGQPNPIASAQPVAINDVGQITGGFGIGGFVLVGGAVTNLGNVTPVDINNSGQVVGWFTTYQLVFPFASTTHAFLYSGSTLVELGTPGVIDARATAINNSGEVVGSLGRGATNLSPATSYGFLYRDGAMIDLGTLGGDSSLPSDINDSGQIVGGSYTTHRDLNSGHAFVYADGIMSDLNSLIDPSLNITLVGARAINNSGQILATGRQSDYYLLTPSTEAITQMPESSSLVMGLTGLLMAAFARRQLASKHAIQSLTD